MGPCILKVEETVFVVDPAKQSWDMDTGFQGYLAFKITEDCKFQLFQSSRQKFWGHFLMPIYAGEFFETNFTS